MFSGKKYLPGQPEYLESVKPVSEVTVYREDVAEISTTTEHSIYIEIFDTDDEILISEEDNIIHCPMQDNIARCDIYLCRVIRNILALPFPDCYGYK